MKTVLKTSILAILYICILTGVAHAQIKSKSVAQYAQEAAGILSIASWGDFIGAIRLSQGYQQARDFNDELEKVGIELQEQIPVRSEGHMIFVSNERLKLVKNQVVFEDISVIYNQSLPITENYRIISEKLKPKKIPDKQVLSIIAFQSLWKSFNGKASSKLVVAMLTVGIARLALDSVTKDKKKEPPQVVSFECLNNGFSILLSDKRWFEARKNKNGQLSGVLFGEGKSGDTKVNLSEDRQAQVQEFWNALARVKDRFCSP